MISDSGPLNLQPWRLVLNLNFFGTAIELQAVLCQADIPAYVPASLTAACLLGHQITREIQECKRSGKLLVVFEYMFKLVTSPES